MTETMKQCDNALPVLVGTQLGKGLGGSFCSAYLAILQFWLSNCSPSHVAGVRACAGCDQLFQRRGGCAHCQHLRVRAGRSCHL